MHLQFKKILAIIVFIVSLSAMAEEMRGAWIHSPNGLGNLGWDATIKLLKDNGFNAVFSNMAWAACSEYPSNVVVQHPSQFTVDGQPVDRLQECLDACRKYGIKLHVWVVCWNMGHRTPNAVKQKMIQDRRVQIALNGTESEYLAPHLPENIELQRQIIQEIVDKYPVDGIHLDYIRYPGEKYDFSASARQSFEQYLGHAVDNWPEDCLEGGMHYQDFAQWRTENITGFVRQISHDLRSGYPDLQLSTAVYTDWNTCPKYIAQNPRAWIDEELLDFICPMDYFADNQEFATCLKQQVKYNNGKIPLYAGIGTYMCSPEQVVEQIKESAIQGADGFVCFQLNQRFANEVMAPVGELLNRNPSRENFQGSPTPQQLSCQFNPSRNRLLNDGHYIFTETISGTIILPEKASFKINSLELCPVGYDLPTDTAQKLVLRQRLSGCQFTTGKLPPGTYRLKFHGQTQEGSPIFARSQVIQILDQPTAITEIIANSPPQFADNGKPKVAVYTQDTYGGIPIFDFLNRSGKFDCAKLKNLRYNSLQKCQVIIIPQAKSNIELFSDQELQDNLRDFVNRGGILIVTHAMVGVRGFINLFPEIVKHPILPPHSPAVWQGKDNVDIHSEFGDCITMVPADGAEIIGTANQQAVIVSGTFGQGKYCAIGLGLGIGAKDRDTQLSPEEQDLLLNLIMLNP